MDFYVILKDLMESRDMSVAEVAKVSGLPDSTVRSILDRKQKKVALNVAFCLSKGLNVSLEYLNGMPDTGDKKSPALSSEAQRVAKEYDALDGHGQRTVRVVMDEELSRMASEAAEPDIAPAKKTVPLFGNAFAAGPGEPDFGNAPETVEIDGASPAQFAVRVAGTSMEPYLHDQTVALGVFGTPGIGDVGAFILDGSYLVKQYFKDAMGNVYLLSLNRAEEDKDVTIWASGNESLLTIGTILMDKKPPLPKV